LIIYVVLEAVSKEKINSIPSSLSLPIISLLQCLPHKELEVAAKKGRILEIDSCVTTTTTKADPLDNGRTDRR